MNSNSITIPIVIGGSTLIGVNTRNGYPIKRGNCFDLQDEAGKGHRIVNFYLENLKEWMRQTKQKDIRVRCIPKSDHLWEICDERIPVEWYSQKYCTVCTPLRMLPLQQRKEYLTENKFKKVFNKDGTWSVLISSEIKAKTQKLNVNWTAETSQELEVCYSKGTEKLLAEKFAAKAINPDYVAKIKII